MATILYRGATSADATPWATDDYEIADEYAADWAGEVYEVTVDGRIADSSWLEYHGFGTEPSFLPLDDVTAALAADGYAAVGPIGDLSPQYGRPHESWVVA